MYKFLQSLRLLLYDLKIITTLNLEDKIAYLLGRKVSLAKVKSKYGKFITSDIILFIKEIKDINNNRDIFDKEIIYVKPITESRLFHTYYVQWLSNNNRILPNEGEVINNLLIESEQLLKLYTMHNSNIDNPIAFANSKKIQPYIINLTMIMDNLIGGNP